MNFLQPGHYISRSVTTLKVFHKSIGNISPLGINSARNQYWLVTSPSKAYTAIRPQLKVSNIHILHTLGSHKQTSVLIGVPESGPIEANQFTDWLGPSPEYILPERGDRNSITTVSGVCRYTCDSSHFPNRIVLKYMKLKHEDHPLLATEEDIAITTSELNKRLELWRSLQSLHMPHIGDVPTSEDENMPERELLLLPSDFSETERTTFSLTELAKEEAQLRQAQLYECVMRLRSVLKSLSRLQMIRRQDSRGQEQNTRSRKLFQTAELIRDYVLYIYDSSRTILLALKHNCPGVQEQFPRITLADLCRKSTVDKRQLGDTYRTDGKIWIAGKSLQSLGHAAHSSNFLRLPGTPNVAPPGEANSSEPPNGDEEDLEIDLRQLWSPTIGLTSEELLQWEHEGEHIHVFVLSFTNSEFR